MRGLITVDARRIIRTEIERTRPLSRVMADQVARLRAWATDHTVPAN